MTDFVGLFVLRSKGNKTKGGNMNTKNFVVMFELTYVCELGDVKLHYEIGWCFSRTLIPIHPFLSAHSTGLFL